MQCSLQEVAMQCSQQPLSAVLTYSSGLSALPRGNHLRVGKPRTPNFSPANGSNAWESGEKAA